MSTRRKPTGIPREQFAFEYQPETDQQFANALAKARSDKRLKIDEGIELLTTGTDCLGIDTTRKEQGIEEADRIREAVAGDEVQFIAHLKNQLTTAWHTGCQC